MIANATVAEAYIYTSAVPIHIFPDFILRVSIHDYQPSEFTLRN
jgi:hypothetical protein